MVWCFENLFYTDNINLVVVEVVQNAWWTCGGGAQGGGTGNFGQNGDARLF